MLVTTVTLFTYGVFGGYQILNRDNLGLAVELGYDDFGRAKFKNAGKVAFKHTNHGAHLSLKGSYSLRWFNFCFRRFRRSTVVLVQL